MQWKSEVEKLKRVNQNLRITIQTLTTKPAPVGQLTNQDCLPPFDIDMRSTGLRLEVDRSM